MADPNYNDILAGIGAGFQSYDPNNMFRGAGAAISANTASRMRREDFATAEQAKIDEELRSIENAKTVRGQQSEEALSFMRKKAQLEKDLRGGVKTLSAGTKGPAAQEWMKQFHKVFGKHMANIPGSAPIDPELDFEIAMLHEGKRRGSEFSMKADRPQTQFQPSNNDGVNKTKTTKKRSALEQFPTGIE